MTRVFTATVGLSNIIQTCDLYDEGKRRKKRGKKLSNGTFRLPTFFGILLKERYLKTTRPIKSWQHNLNAP